MSLIIETATAGSLLTMMALMVLLRAACGRLRSSRFIINAARFHIMTDFLRNGSQLVAVSVTAAFYGEYDHGAAYGRLFSPGSFITTCLNFHRVDPTANSFGTRGQSLLNRGGLHQVVQLQQPRSDLAPSPEGDYANTPLRDTSLDITAAGLTHFVNAAGARFAQPVDLQVANLTPYEHPIYVSHPQSQAPSGWGTSKGYSPGDGLQDPPPLGCAIHPLATEGDHGFLDEDQADDRTIVSAPGVVSCVLPGDPDVLQAVGELGPSFRSVETLVVMLLRVDADCVVPDRFVLELHYDSFTVNRVGGL
ncbi:hypothetical protein BDK51DRAFT_50419 [Blyttiomyces helicus]|uniref:Uncharacterized protein n=1 Tax=Blyttiomyces helicus TaxID=388810 RepID=A0A4P9W3W5_9FUNG|nr:hypothetical protein BDK51DRAFT_50419 [Blyttiomyces helicus]|eukprot:RKO86542.1 hypothetical protein BDK51DRAFT_50419 [Blyttiomyces helicus]